MSGEVGGGPGIESGGTGVAVLDHIEPPPVTEPSVRTDLTDTAAHSLTDSSTESGAIKTPEQKLQDARDILIKASNIYVKDLKLESPDVIDRATNKDTHPQENVLATLYILGSSEMPPQEFVTPDRPNGIPITVNGKPLEVQREEGSPLEAKFLAEIKADGTAVIKVLNDDGTYRSETVQRSDLFDAEIRAEGDKLYEKEKLPEGSTHRLTQAQMEVLRTYRSIILVRDFRDTLASAEIFNVEFDKNVKISNEELDQAEEEIDRSPPFEDITALSKFKEDHTKHKEFLQNLINKYRTEPDPETKERLLTAISKLQNDYDADEKHIAGFSRKRIVRQWEKDMVEISESIKPELIELRKKMEDALLLPGGIAKAIKLWTEHYGVKFDPTLIEKYGKTAGKMSLLVALGLMYALMKSGKEQQGGAYH